LAPAGSNLIQFGSMIKHETGKSPLSYDRYGWHRGRGGGPKPRGGHSRCCHAHDCCYKRISSSHCSPKLVIYRYSIQRSQITCGLGNWCQRQTCECDKQAAECFRRTARTYNSRYKNYPRSQCKGRSPFC
ncbi:Group IIE secretory phospholipase A2, partial [Charadrius vociferus]